MIASSAQGTRPKASRVLVADRPRPAPHLAGTGFPAPRVRHARDGGHSTATLTWIEGSSSADGWANVVPEGRPAALGKGFPRRCHNTVAGYRPPATSCSPAARA